MLDEKRRKQYSVEGGKHAECIVDFLDMVVLQASKRTGEMVKSMAAEHEEKFDSDPRVNDETHKEEAVTSRESSGDVASQDLKLGQQDSTSSELHGEYSAFAEGKSDSSPSLFRASVTSEGKQSEKRHRHRHRRHHHHHHHHHHQQTSDEDDDDDDDDEEEAHI